MAESEHKHGEMDISEQEKTFEGFVKLAVWTVAISLLILVFLALVNG